MGFDPLHAEEERTLAGHTMAVRSMVNHGDKLIRGSADNTIKVWSTDTWTCERSFEGHNGTVYSMLMHGDKLFSGSSDNTIKVWSTATWTCELTSSPSKATIIL
jgi:WD40 repeat protein